MTLLDSQQDHIHDIIGVGFGPANIAVAVALTDDADSHPNSTPIDAIFFESSSDANWHPGMLLPEAMMQIAFPKDLATLRNPRSRFSFFNYLFEHDRLTDFINLQTFFPSRQEISDYIRWTAHNVGARVQYNTRVTAITHDHNIAVVHTVAADGTTNSYRTRTVLLGTGLTPQLPAEITESSRISHSIKVLPFLEQFHATYPTAPKTLAVLGGGQSAAEIARFLHHTYPDAQVHLIHSRYGLTPSDDSPFANRVFDPDAVDKWHAAPPSERERLRAVHAGTNYTAVDPDLLNELFRICYNERISKQKRLFIHDTTSMLSHNETDTGLILQLNNHLDGSQQELAVDLLICCTGFTESHPKDLLVDFPDLPVDNRGRALVQRDYRLDTGNKSDPAIYLCGGVEHSHGFSSSLLSLVSIRAGEILDSVRTHLTNSANTSGLSQ